MEIAVYNGPTLQDFSFIHTIHEPTAELREDRWDKESFKDMLQCVLPACHGYGPLVPIIDLPSGHHIL